MKKIIGIGNALTDVLVTLENDKILSNFSLEKGSMSLVGQDTQQQIAEQTAELPHTLSLGGSASNTIRAMAKLGAQVGYIGKVGADTTGDFFEQALINLDIEPLIMRSKTKSGSCISLVSKDGERTMATYLGAALEMSHQEINTSKLSEYDCLYVEGYLVQDHSLIENAVKIAKNLGLKVAIDLASFNVVEQNLDFLQGLIKNHIDIIFANEQEAFTNKSNPREALDIIAENCDIAVVKVGKKGAYIKQNGEVTQVGIMKQAQRIDTTGAGDFYAAGFLWGLSKGLNMQQCGTIGSITAGKVIEIVGTTLGQDTWMKIKNKIKEVEQETYLF